jgi:pilus assembly protein CpaF
VHANSARDALAALVNAAIMAGENVSEPIVRKVFAASLDLVVHLDLDDSDPGAGIRRQVMEVIAVVPSLHDDFSSEPIFARAGIGAPLEWTGAMPPDVSLLERRLPAGVRLRDVLEGRSVPL